jgi:hypothetical protein
MREGSIRWKASDGK